MSTRIRVATVVTRFQAGAGQVALHGALALDARDYEVTVVAGSGDRLLEEAGNRGLDVVRVPALRSPISPVHDVRALRDLEHVIARRHFDVVHTHSAKAGTLGRIAAHRSGVARIVHTFHGLPYHEFQSAPRRAAYVGIERRLGRITDRALCVGTGVAVEVVRRGLVAPERIRTINVVAGGTPVPRTPASRAAARRRLGLPADARVVGAVGRLDYQKAPEDFVAAMAALDRPGVVGVWIGSGPLAERMRELAARTLPRARVVLVGERADVAHLLPALDVFALPSRYEGLPVAVVEAMAAGVPVVATAVNAVSDVVVPGRTGLLVPPRQPHLLAAAIRHLLDHPELAEAMAMAGRAWIGDRFDDSALADELVTAYAEDVPAHQRDKDQRIPCA